MKAGVLQCAAPHTAWSWPEAALRARPALAAARDRDRSEAARLCWVQVRCRNARACRQTDSARRALASRDSYTAWPWLL